MPNQRIQSPLPEPDLASTRLSMGRSLRRRRSTVHTVAVTAPQEQEAVTVRLKAVNTTDTTTAEPELITTDELARMLRVDPSSVRRWRTARPIQGPPFIALSERVIMYSVEDVRAWLSSRRVAPEAA